MKLFMSTSSPFSRKVRVVVREHGLEKRVQEIAVAPLDNPAELRAVNPLGQVPALVLTNGFTFFDSGLITEYLETRHGNPRFYPPDATRWEALRRAALAEGAMEAAVATVMEKRRTDAEQSDFWLDRWRKAIDCAMDSLAAEIDPRRFDIGDLGLAVMLDYLDFRLPDMGWRERHSDLAPWLEHHLERPSLAATRPA